jgi:hypothetical protein
MTLGMGTTISFSNKLKVNTKSSTESEIVGANQALSFLLHTRYFIKAQGFSIKQNILFQDNQSTVCLEVNSSFSRSKRTRHIKCRYFFIQNKLLPQQNQVGSCPHKPKTGRPIPPYPSTTTVTLNKYLPIFSSSLRTRTQHRSFIPGVCW